ncbi:acyl carrier protein [Streptomyces sp. NPDC056161]|uniref:acyl carrier protein n=1 Tax=Streptomyces sp. NPDC056161 TaxID=3345732 RepID=UPI0035E2B9A6
MNEASEDLLAEVTDWYGGRLARPCGADERLFSSGRLDSLTLMEMVAWAETAHGVVIAPEDLSLANFDTARQLAAYLSGRGASA